VKSQLVSVLFSSSSCLEFVAGYRRLDRTWVAGLTVPRPLGEVLVFTKISW
jgi:hypothetical protein